MELRADHGGGTSEVSFGYTGISAKDADEITAAVGAIVAELNQPAGLGARLLQGSYYGQTVQIWATLFLCAILAALAVMVIAAVERGAWRVQRSS